MKTADYLLKFKWPEEDYFREALHPRRRLEELLGDISPEIDYILLDGEGKVVSQRNGFRLLMAHRNGEKFHGTDTVGFRKPRVIVE